MKLLWVAVHVAVSAMTWTFNTIVAMSAGPESAATVDLLKQKAEAEHELEELLAEAERLHFEQWEYQFPQLSN